MVKIIQSDKLENTLKDLADFLLKCIEELMEYKETTESEFQYGERVAYTECLEYLQYLTTGIDLGLDFDIEERYPL